MLRRSSSPLPLECRRSLSLRLSLCFFFFSRRRSLLWCRDRSLLRDRERERCRSFCLEDEPRRSEISVEADSASEEPDDSREGDLRRLWGGKAGKSAGSPRAHAEATPLTGLGLAERRRLSGLREALRFSFSSRG